jgi:hypothetical protein
MRGSRCDAPAPNPLRQLIDPLDWVGFPYCEATSIAPGIHGEPGLTTDNDVVLLLRAQDFSDFCSEFPEEIFYGPPAETLRVDKDGP